MKTVFAMKNLLLFAVAFCSFSLSAAEWSLDLVGAIPPQHTVQVFLREHDGAVTHAFALVPTFTKSSGLVDASALRRQKDVWDGSLKITIPSDGWNPPQGTTTQVELRVQTDASGTLRWQRVNGQGEGTVVVHPLSPQTFNPALGSLTAVGANPQVPGTVISKGHRAKNLLIRLALCDDRVHLVLLREQASPVDTGNDIMVTKNDVRYSQGKWQGSIEAVVCHQENRAPVPWVGQIEFVTIGSKIAGSLRVKNGTTEESFPLSGNVQPVAETPENSILTPLFLFGALPSGANLECYLELKNGQVLTGFATGPNANNATHIVDAKNLFLKNGRLKGTMGVVLMADPWVPPDHLPRPMMVQIEAAVTASGAAVAGTYNGRYGSEAITGVVGGLFQPSISASIASKVMIKFEDGLLGAGDKSWFRRVFVGANLDAHGKVIGGKIGNNHSSLTGTTDSGQFLCPPGRLEGEVSLSASAGNIQAGKYRFRFKGSRVGEMATGLFELLGTDNEVLKTGSFWASVDMKRGE